ncbi:unnamed protein product [Peniophora sp. CBMAI 1063]|nr:unnamed protein product [Peniophora sp. CBMAI 1063]
MAVLHDLPPELLGYILIHVDVRDVCHCLQVCRLLHDIVVTTPSLHYNHGLAAAGMIDGPTHCPLSLMERLSLLQQRREAWRTLEPTLTMQVAEPSKVQLEHPTALEMRALDLGLSIDDMRHGLLGEADPEIFDWRNDPAQDLLVILDQNLSNNGHPHFVRFYFRTWSSGGSADHPDAIHPFIDINVDHRRYNGTSWHLMGHLLAIVARTGERAQQLYVVDWENDVTKLSITIIGDWQDHVTDTQILDESCVAMCTSATVRIYDIRGLTFTGNPLVVLQLPMHRSSSCPVSRKQQFGSMLENIPFTEAPFTGDRIFVIRQIPYIAEMGSRGFFYIMLVNSLLRLFRQADQANTGTRTLQWDGWGPDNTRVLCNRAELRIDRLLSGSRLLWPTFDVASHFNILRYEILDFSRSPSARAGVAPSPLSLASDFTLHEEASATEEFHDGEQLVPAVHSRLAYSSTTLSFPNNGETISIEEFLNSDVNGWYPVELHEDRLTRVLKRGGVEVGEIYVF